MRRILAAPVDQPEEEEVAAKLTEAPPEVPASVEVESEEAESGPPADKEPDSPDTAPMRRGDYIPASGSSSIREMKPRGTFYGGTPSRPPAEIHTFFAV